MSSQARHPPSSTAILAEITAGLSSGRNLPELLSRFLEPVVRLAGAQGGAVRVLDDTHERLQLVCQAGTVAPTCRGQGSADRHCGYCGEAARVPRVVWAEDLQPCRVETTAATVDNTPLPTRMLVVPLQHRGRVFGVYNLFYAAAQEPDGDVLGLLKTVGELLGLALHNARLEDESLRATLLHERQLMAAEVHDSVAQALAFVRMRLPLLQDATQMRDDSRAAQYFEELRGAVSQAHTSLRCVLSSFRAPMDPMGLEHALAASAQTFRRSTGSELEFTNELPGLQLSPDMESQVFHIVQEALSNVARHAGAHHAWLHIAPAGDRVVRVVIEDDGNGLPRSRGAGGHHFGLDIMRDRARRIGGALDVGARLGGGTRVSLTFPVAH